MNLWVKTVAHMLKLTYPKLLRLAFTVIRFSRKDTVVEPESIRNILAVILRNSHPDKN